MSRIARACPVYVRWGIARDMPRILAIEGASFDYPWTHDDFMTCLRKRNCISMVAERESAVVGFMVYELHETWIRLLNFAVAPECRRQGVGRHLAAKLRYKLESHRRHYLVLAVRESNLSAQLFFRAMGYRATRVVPDFFEGGETAIRMELRAEDES